MSEYLDPVVVRVKADVDDALVKLRLVRDTIKEIRDHTARIRIKEEFDKGKLAAAGVADAVKKVDQEIKKADQDTKSWGQSWRGVFSDVRKGFSDANGGRFGLGKIGGVFKGLFKDLAKSGKDVWAAMKDVWSALVSGDQAGVAAAKAFGNLGSSLAGLATSAAATGPALLVVAGIVAALIIPVGALVSGLLAAAGALVAGAIGIGALIAVGMPAVRNLQTSLTALSTATSNYQQASQNLNIGLKHSAQDMAQYQTVLQGVDANLRPAVKLLRDGSVQWQNLSKSQRNSVVALSENNAALRNMSPAMKQTLNALLAEKAAWDNLTPAQQRFSRSLSALDSAWKKVQAAAQPALTMLLTDLAKLATDALPLVTPLINATAKAIDHLLKRADAFVKTEKFKEWVKKLTDEIPGVISEVGKFISKILGMVGPLITGKKNVQDLHNTLHDLAVALQDVINVIHWLDVAFRGVDWFVRHFGSTLLGLLGPIGQVYGAVSALVNIISMLPGMGGGSLPKMGGGSIPTNFGQFPSGLASQPGHRERGTPGAPPGWAWTGEAGPELVRFTGGEVVIPHGPSVAISRGYANGTGGMLMDDRPIIVNVDGKTLFKLTKSKTYGYNVANGNRGRAGQPSGTMVPR